MKIDQRQNDWQAWVKLVSPIKVIRFEPLSGDASFRRYARVYYRTHTAIAVDAHPDKEANEPFIRLAHQLRQLGLHVPELLALNKLNGFFLVSDLGDTHYLDVLSQQPKHVHQLYQRAFDVLMHMQKHSKVVSSTVPVFDRPLIESELSLFVDWYVKVHKQYTLSQAERAQLSTLFELLITQATEQPRVLVHRDFHSRNLLILPGYRVGVLDFQDAVYGPVTYDLVSLLRDCYIKWPEKEIIHWVKAYYNRLRHNQRLSQVSLATFQRWFDWIGVQRHLKVLGIFARLHHRDGKSAYINDMPRVVDYVLEVSKQYKTLVPLHQLLKRISE